MTSSESSDLRALSCFQELWRESGEKENPKDESREQKEGGKKTSGPEKEEKKVEIAWSLR